MGLQIYVNKCNIRPIASKYNMFGNNSTKEANRNKAELNLHIIGLAIITDVILIDVTIIPERGRNRIVIKESHVSLSYWNQVSLKLRLIL